MAQTQELNAYIDEAGDEGFVTVTLPGRGSSEWFVVGAVIAPKENDLELSHAVDDLRTLLERSPPKPLHFRHLGHNQRRAAMDLLGRRPLTFSIVALWKPTQGDRTFPKPPYMYNWACRLLVERLTWHAQANGRKVNLYFSNRASTSYADLRAYLQMLQADPQCAITPNTINDFRSVNQQVKLIQVADFYTTATFMALEPDSFGNSEEDYLMRVRHQLYRRGQNLFSYGFKVWPTTGRDLRRYPWLAQL